MFPRFALICALIFAAFPALHAERVSEAFAASRLEVFDAVWRYIDETYYDPDFGGKDWEAIGERYRHRLEDVSDRAQLRALVQSMLFELGESHFAILPATLADLSVQPAGVGGYAGFDLAFAGEGLAVYRVAQSGPAWKAGLRDGDRLHSVGGKSVAELVGEVAKSGLPERLAGLMGLHRVANAFIGRPGHRVEVEAIDPKGKKKQVEIELAAYEGRMAERFGNFGPSPVALETEMLAGELAYLRFSLWFPSIMPEIRAFVSGLEGRADGLIVDLRGNPGGIGLMAGGLAGLLLSEQVNLGTITLREGHLNIVGFPQKGAFSGPVAVLIDGASASTSEIFALGMQEAGRARIFGQRSAGAALPSVLTTLPNGDLLQSVMGDLRTPSGVSLEGAGVLPDEAVDVSLIDLSEGSDTVLFAAIQWIEQTRPTSDL